MMRRPPRSTRTDTRLPYPTRCRAAPSQDRAMPDASSGLARTAQILRFLLKYRSAGAFTGLDLHAASPSPEPPPTEGRPEEFVNAREARGPTCLNIPQELGRATCRARVCPHVEIPVCRVSEENEHI